jgi:hypothetical protein
MTMASDPSAETTPLVVGLDAPTDAVSDTEPAPTATDPYLELTAQPQAEPNAATATEPSATEPYLALASPSATDTGATPPQDPIPADQLYADTQIDSSPALDAPATQPQPETSVPPTPPDDPLQTTQPQGL